MTTGNGISRIIGASLLGATVAAIGLHASGMGMPQQARAAALPPLAGYWFSPQQNAPITTLRISVLPVLANNEPTGRMMYSIDAFGGGKDLGFRTAPVPQNPSTPVTVSYQSSSGTCLPRFGICTPLSVPVVTTLTMTRPNQFLELQVTTHVLSLTRTTHEEMTTPF
jgi:hypothetical protein